MGQCNALVHVAVRKGWIHPGCGDEGFEGLSVLLGLEVGNTQVVIGLGICRITVNGLLERAYRFGVAFSLEECDSPEMIGRGIGRIDRECLVESPYCLFIVFPPCERDAQVIVRRAIFRLQGGCPFERPDRLIIAFTLGKCKSLAIEGLWIIRREFKCLVIGEHRFEVFTHTGEGGPALVPCRGTLAVDLQHAIKSLHCLFCLVLCRKCKPGIIPGLDISGIILKRQVEYGNGIGKPGEIDQGNSFFYRCFRELGIEGNRPFERFYGFFFKAQV